MLDNMLTATSYLTTFEKASSQKEILSALHQAVVEIVTLRDSSLPLTYDLSHVAYNPDALAVLSGTLIEFDHNSKQTVLKYKDGGKRSILDAIHSNDIQETIGPHGSLPVNADPGVEALEATQDITLTAPDQESQGLRLQETGSPVQDMEVGQIHRFVNNKEEMDNGKGGVYKKKY